MDIPARKRSQIRMQVKVVLNWDNNTWGEPQGIWQVMAVAMVGADMICILSVAMLALLLAIL